MRRSTMTGLSASAAWRGLVLRLSQYGKGDWLGEGCEPTRQGARSDSLLAIRVWLEERPDALTGQIFQSGRDEMGCSVHNRGWMVREPRIVVG